MTGRESRPRSRENLFASLIAKSKNVAEAPRDISPVPSPPVIDLSSEEGYDTGHDDPPVLASSEIVPQENKIVPQENKTKEKDQNKDSEYLQEKKRGKIKCSFCDKSFSSFGNLTMHMKHKHNEEKGKDSSTNSSHVNSQCQIANEVFTCKVCQEKFDNHKKISFHIIKEHSKFSCVECRGSIFLTDLKLRNHLKSEHFNTEH